MGTHDREITGDREQTIDGGVVLRFPGDWVGPLEDLVPFGPSADRDSPPAETEGDFWGEGSAALQDALEAAPQPEPERVAATRRLRNTVMAGGTGIAAVLVAVALLIGGQNSRAPHSHGVTFAVASIPPLAPATRGGKRHIAIRKRRPAVQRPRSHASSARPVVTAKSGGGGSSPTVVAASSTYHPVPAPSSASSGSTTRSSGSSSQSGGAFTLGGP